MTAAKKRGALGNGVDLEHDDRPANVQNAARCLI
jgi:hypothetical protein